MIAQGIALEAKRQFLIGMHQPTDTYKIALYTKRANIGPATAHYTDEGEVSGQGYTRGGIALTGFKAEMVGKNAAITFNDAKIDRATFYLLPTLALHLRPTTPMQCGRRRESRLRLVENPHPFYQLRGVQKKSSSA